MKANQDASQEEIKWATAIKEAAMADPDTAAAAEEMTGLEFVQHAIVSKDKVDKALLRIKRLQAFKNRYGIQRDGSYEDGVRDIIAFIQAFPGMLIGFSVATDGAQTICYDFARYKVRTIHTDEAYAVCMRSFFYTLQAADKRPNSVSQPNIF